MLDYRFHLWIELRRVRTSGIKLCMSGLEQFPNALLKYPQQAVLWFSFILHRCFKFESMACYFGQPFLREHHKTWPVVGTWTRLRTTGLEDLFLNFCSPHHLHMKESFGKTPFKMFFLASTSTGLADTVGRMESCSNLSLKNVYAGITSNP